MRHFTVSRYHRLFNSARTRASMSVLSAIVVLMTLGGCMMKSMASPEDFIKEDRRLTEQITSSKDPDFLSDIYLKRARLRLRYDNPGADCRGALDDLQHTVDLKPNQRQVENIKDWLTALHRLTYLEQEADKFRTKNVQAERQIRTLQNNVQALRKTIEELQSLELQMEQKRQRLR